MIRILSCGCEAEGQQLHLNLRLEVDGKTQRCTTVTDTTASPQGRMEAIVQLCQLVPAAWGSDYFGWWQRWQALLQDHASANASARDWVTALESAVLGVLLERRQLTVAAAVASNALGIDLSTVAAGMKDLAPADLLENEQEGFRQRIDIAAAENSERELRRRLEQGQRRIGLRLSGDVRQDADGLTHLLTLAQDVEGGAEEWTLLGEGRFASVGDLAGLWQELKDNRSISRQLAKVKAVVDPFPQDWALADAVLVGFVEWPQRPGVIAGATDWTQVRRALDIGYRGVYAPAAMGPMDMLLRACMIAWKRIREPVGRWTMTAANPLALTGSGAGVQEEVVGLVCAAI